VLLQHVAKARGKLRPGGTADTIAAARVVLSDWNDGRIRFYTEPPQRSSGGHDGAAIVKDWAADFSADQVRMEEAAVCCHEGHFAEETPPNPQAGCPLVVQLPLWSSREYSTAS